MSATCHPTFQFASSDRLPQNDELLPLEELERRAILRALRQASSDKLAAARLLGIGKTTLYRKLRNNTKQRLTQFESYLQLRENFHFFFSLAFDFSV